MTVTQYYAGSSLDGFLADPHDSLDWLLDRRTDDGGPPGYGPFIAATGAMAMGATTYEWVLRHEAAPDGTLRWPYEVPCWVFTHRDLPVPDGARVVRTQADVVAVHREMVAAAAGRNVWLVGGGELVGRFADEGLLDEVLLALAPVTLGAGAPLLPRRVELRLEEVGRNGDFACTRYTVVKG